MTLTESKYNQDGIRLFFINLHSWITAALSTVSTLSFRNENGASIDSYAQQDRAIEQKMVCGMRALFSLLRSHYIATVDYQ